MLSVRDSVVQIPCMHLAHHTLPIQHITTLREYSSSKADCPLISLASTNPSTSIDLLAMSDRMCMHRREWGYITTYHPRYLPQRCQTVSRSLVDEQFLSG